MEQKTEKLKRAQYINEITKMLALWSSKIKVDNASGLYDINLLSEKILSQLLSILYNVELENLNISPGKNFSGVDLVDKKNKIAYQVITRFSLNKIIHSLNKFNSQDLRKEYSNGIKFFILSEDTTRIIRRNFQNIDPYFNKRTDIIGFSDLLKELNLTEIATVEKFKNILEREFSELPKSSQIFSDPIKEKLIQRLNDCQKGRESWQEYENICIEILKISFKSSFRNFDIRIQLRNENGIDIKDAVIPNRSEIPL